MKKFILKASFFVILFFIVNLIYLKIIQKYDRNFSKALEVAKFNNRDFQCIAIGSSLVFDGIDTEFLTQNGIPSYNLSIDGAVLKTNYLQLQEYLKSNKEPETVILGLSSCINQKIDSEKVHPIMDFIVEPFSFSIEELPLIKFKWLGNELIKRLVSKDHREAEIVLGQFKSERVVPDNSKFSSNEVNRIDSTKYKESMYLTKFDSICKNHGIRLLIIEMPGLKYSQNGIKQGPFIFKNMIGNQIEIINLNNREFCSMFEDHKDWLGLSHLNIHGARKLTKFIYEDILAD